MNTVKEALDVLVKAIEKAGYVPGKDVSLAMDPAASEFFEDGQYNIDGKYLDPDQMVGYYEEPAERLSDHQPGGPLTRRRLTRSPN